MCAMQTNIYVSGLTTQHEVYWHTRFALHLCPHLLSMKSRKYNKKYHRGHIIGSPNNHQTTNQHTGWHAICSYDMQPPVEIICATCSSILLPCMFNTGLPASTSCPCSMSGNVFGTNPLG